jgi:hypothetical protein
MLPLIALLQAGDDSGWINAGIQAAIAQGRASYSVPAGNYSLAKPIVIPAGTQNFTLKGAGSGRTILTASDPAVKQAIQVGVLPQLHNNWMITGPANLPLANAPAGTSTLMLAKAQATLAAGYYVLWDDNLVVCAKGPNVSMNHAEIVRVTGYKANGTVFLDVPTGREYGPRAMLAPYQNGTCVNIGVSGFGFRGGPTDGLVAVGIVDRAALSDLSVEGFRSDAIMTNTSRNVTIDNARISLATDGDAGSGYGFAIYRSRFVTVTNSTATACRHGFMVHSGSMDVTFSNCYTTNGFDMHGYDERRIALFGCSGDGGDVGNDAWLAGARDVLIQRCSFTETLGFHANVRNVRVVDTEFGGVAVYSVEPGTTPTVGVPAGGYADGVRFDRCTIRGTGFTLFWESGANRMGTFSFNRCLFENLSTSWGTALDVGRMSGTLVISDSTLRVRSLDHVVQIANVGQGYNFQMRRCRLEGEGRLGVWIKSVYGGSATLTDNVYVGGVTQPAFMVDDTGRAINLRNVAYEGT